MSACAGDVQKLYRERFPRAEQERKDGLWKVLCSSFFQKFVPRNAAVLDLGAGYCEFINHIDCATKYAVDPNADTVRCAGPEVKVFTSPATDLSFLPDHAVDVVFVSNLLEHMGSKEDVLVVLREAWRVLKPQGRLLVLQPNIRFLYKEYWDFFDHRIPMSDRSLAEALCLVGFSIEELLPAFLPYTTKSRFPQSPWLVRLYLLFPLLWKVFGKQAFVLARKACRN